MARLQDLLNQDNGYISMAELDAIEAAQRGQPIGQIPGSFGPGQGSFQRSGGNRVDLTPQGWQDTQTQQMMAPASGGQGAQLDYANPLDYMGAKGYRLKGDSTRALLNDGRMVNLTPGDVGAQMVARQKADAAQLDMDLKRQQLENAKGADWHIDSASGMMINKRSGEIKPIGGAGGKQMPKPDQWKYDAGSDTWVAPPSAENPEGKVTVPASRANAAKSLQYVAGQFSKIMESTPQGGFMGIKGMAGGVTDSQSARRFDNLREQMSAEVRRIFRIPGEGALSDKEQAQYGLQLPDRRNDKETNVAIINDLVTRTGINIGGGKQQPTNQGQFDADKEKRYQEWKRSRGL